MKLKARKTVRKRPAPATKKIVTSGPPPSAASQSTATSAHVHVGAYDPVVLLIFSILIGIGVVMVFSSSGVFSYVKLQDSSYYLKQEVKWLLISSVALMAALMMDYRYYAKIALPGLLFSFFLMALVPFIGSEINGAKRWLVFGGMSLHVGEVAKLAMVVYMAVFLAACGKKITDVKNFAMAIGSFVVCAMFLLLMPDFSMVALIGMVVMGMIFVAGARMWHVAFCFIAGIAACIPVIALKPYRLARIMGYMNPEADPLGAGWQKIQAMIAVANGGLFGRGLGDSIQKRMFLPQQHTDFIFSIIGEEFGLMGMAFIAALYVALVYRGLAIARNCQDLLGKYLAIGIVWMIGLQAGFNMGVAVGLFPVTGQTLPCISFGGSSLICIFLCFGILLNVSAHSGRRSRRPNEDDNTGGRRDGGAHISGNGGGGAIAVPIRPASSRRRQTRRPGAANSGGSRT